MTTGTAGPARAERIRRGVRAALAGEDAGALSLGEHAHGSESGLHRIGIARPAMVALFAAFAGYATVFALLAHGAESVWGAWAAVGYGAATVIAASSWRRFPALAPLVALAGAFALPAALLPSNVGATSEVRVVARAASLWLRTGTPYLPPAQLSSWRSYDPYLPGMSLFGLPRAIGLPGVLGSPLLWLALATFALLVAACRIATPRTARRCHRCNRTAVLRSLLLVSSPVFAFPMALGVTDPPMIGLVCLSLALVARGVRSDRFAGAHEPDGRALWEDRHADADGRSGHPLAAGVAVGVACALKATAWPALPVVLALVAVRDGKRAATRFAASALASLLALIAVTAPDLFAKPRALWQNLVEYPLGLSHRLTPAASPLPGHVLASAGTLGHAAAIVLLGAAALAVGVSLVVWPPRDVTQAAIRLAIGLSAMFLLAPDARFGYFAYPLGILAWLALAVTIPRRLPARADALVVSQSAPGD